MAGEPLDSSRCTQHWSRVAGIERSIKEILRRHRLLLAWLLALTGGFVITWQCCPDYLEPVGVWVGSAVLLIVAFRVVQAVDEGRDKEQFDYAHEIAHHYHQVEGGKTNGLSGSAREDAWTKIEAVLYYLREPKDKGVLPGCYGDYINSACDVIIDSAPQNRRRAITEDLIRSCVDQAVKGKPELQRWVAVLHDDIPKDTERSGKPAYESFQNRVQTL